MSKMNVNFFSLHIGDFLGGVISMDAEEIGAYTMLLIAHYQVGAGGLPNDDAKLAKIAKVTTQKWSKIKKTILAKFIVDETEGLSVIKNLKVIDELSKMQIKSNAAKDKALKRWNTGDAVASCQHMPGACSGDAIHKPIGEDKESSPVKRKKNAPEKPPTFYRFEGKVVCLTDPDFDRLHALAGMSLEGWVRWLDAEDEYLATLPEEKRKNWWHFLNAKVKGLNR